NPHVKLQRDRVHRSSPGGNPAGFVSAADSTLCGSGSAPSLFPAGLNIPRGRFGETSLPWELLTGEGRDGSPSGLPSVKLILHPSAFYKRSHRRPVRVRSS
ncbi:MAG: hypothetical protein OSA95_10845, partial [Opitutales bacterium]|nr:hypothetical protein [Opitutales bacterium]